jgi:hypothetical protein
MVMDADVRKEFDWIYDRLGIKPPWLSAPPVDPIPPVIPPGVPVLTDTGIEPVSVGSTPYIIDMSHQSGYLQSRIWNGWQFIAYYLYNKYPDRQARRMEFIQACPAPGESFPDSYHNQGLDKIDLHYFTKGPNNHTQYTIPGEPRTDIWTEDGELNWQVFDAPRNLDLFIMISKIFPRAQINVDERIANNMGLKWLCGDYPGQYNHDRHTHVQCKGFNAKAVM